MNIARYNYPSQFGTELPILTEEIGRILHDGQYVLSDMVNNFEIAFALYLKAGYSCGVNSGTDALLLSLMACGIGPGDEVITQANTFHATVAAICLCGATPVLVDAQEGTFLMDQSQLTGAITGKTRAIMPVHLFGKPTPMDSLLSLAAQNGLVVIEDAAQAHGARIDGKRVGTIGDIGCFSFHPSKNLAAAGDAGAIVTNNADLYREVKIRRGLGQEGQNHHVAIGLNSKLDAIQALVLHKKLKFLDEWNDKRRRVAGLYKDWLKDLPLRFQAWETEEEHVFHLFQIGTDQREPLMAHLRARGVDMTIRYPTPIHLQPAFAHLGWKKGAFPVAEKLAGELCCLPIRPDMSDDEVAYVCEQVRCFFRSGC